MTNHPIINTNCYIIQNDFSAKLIKRTIHWETFRIYKWYAYKTYLELVNISKLYQVPKISK